MSSFITLYKQSDKLENFTTELFVLALQYLLHNGKSDTVRKVLAVLDIPFDESVSIETQVSETASVAGYEVPCRPDIVVTAGGKRYFVEVKVNAELNHYTVGAQDYDQIQLYQGIKNASGVRCLSKYRVFSRGLEKQAHNVLWMQIYEAMQSSAEHDDFVIRHFLDFLKEHGMGTLELVKNDVERIFEIYAPLHELIKRAWSECGSLSARYHLAENIVLDDQNGYNWFGLDVKDSNSALAWVGMYGYDTKNLVFVAEQGLKFDKKSVSDEDENGNPILGKLPLSEIYTKTTAQAQLDCVVGWLKSEVITKVK